MKRFFNKVNKTKSCWLWLAGSRGSGYGSFRFKGKTVDAHRVSWILHFGDIPKNLYVCHTCDVRSCVNPEHLFLGTHSDNMKDAYKKGRLNTDKVKKDFVKGHKPTNRLLKSDEEIKKVKDAIRNRTGTLKSLAEKLHLPYTLIRDISSGRVY